MFSACTLLYTPDPDTAGPLGGLGATGPWGRGEGVRVVCRPYPSEPAPSRPRPLPSPPPCRLSPSTGPFHNASPLLTMPPNTPTDPGLGHVAASGQAYFGLRSPETFPGSRRCLTSMCLRQMRPFLGPRGPPGVHRSLGGGALPSWWSLPAQCPGKWAVGPAGPRTSHVNASPEALVAWAGPP